MNDPIEIFEDVYKEWRPPDRPVPTRAFTFLPLATACGVFLVFLIVDRAPVRERTDRTPSAILASQISGLDSGGETLGGR